MTRKGQPGLVPVNSQLYQKYKNQPDFQAFADKQMGKLIAAQHRRYDPKFLGGTDPNLKPSNLYQEYLQTSGLMHNPDRYQPQGEDD